MSKLVSYRRCLRQNCVAMWCRSGRPLLPRQPLLKLTDVRRALSSGAGPATDDRFDYVLVGAGSAGSVVANRLVDGDRNCRVLIVEAGSDKDQSWKIQMPPGMLFLLGNKQFDWCYETTPQVVSSLLSRAVPRTMVASSTTSRHCYLSCTPALRSDPVICKSIPLCHQSTIAIFPLDIFSLRKP